MCGVPPALMFQLCPVGRVMCRLDLGEAAFSATQMAAVDILGPDAAPARLGDGPGQPLTAEQWDEAVCQVQLLVHPWLPCASQIKDA